MGLGMYVAFSYRNNILKVLAKKKPVLWPPSWKMASKNRFSRLLKNYSSYKKKVLSKKC